MDTFDSRMSHPRTSAAISRSESLMSPSLFVPAANLAATSGGHLNCHTLGAIAFVPCTHTLPVLSLGASKVPLYPAVPGMSSLMLVGSLDASRVISYQSRSALLPSGHLA